MILRPATPLDAGPAGAILTAFAAGTAWMPRLHTAAEDIGFLGTMIDRGWVTVAVGAHKVSGFIARDGAEINALYVAPEARGQGIGTALLAGAQNAHAHLTLWTFEANEGAQRFYERHGFRAVERTDGSGNDEGLPDIRYEWRRSTG